MKWICCLLFVVLITTTNVEAKWDDAVVEVSGGWGTDIGSFALDESESNFEGPPDFCVTRDNSIAIADALNYRVKIYHNKALTKTFEFPGFFWCVDNTLLVQRQTDLHIYGLNGERLKIINDSNVIHSVSSGMFVTQGQNKFRLYNGSGELIRVSDSEPTETGSLRSLGPFGKVITYKDRAFRINAEPVLSYALDKNGYLNVVGAAVNASGDSDHYTVCKYSKYGQELACIHLPETDVVDAEEGLTINRIVDEPVVSNDGDVYAANTSRNGYQIVLWKWQDEPLPPYIPDSPTGFSTDSLDDAVMLRWEPSVQDPGCVTGYEIARSDTRGGTYTSLATVPKGTITHKDKSVTKSVTYYYKIRTISEDKFSAFSAEVSGATGPPTGP